jgi:hypothetical protein
MRNNNNAAKHRYESGPNRKRLNGEQVWSQQTYTPVRHMGAYNMKIGVKALWPAVYAPAAPQLTPEQIENAAKAANSPFGNVIAADAVRQQGMTIADRHLLEVERMRMERERTGQALMGDPTQPAYDTHANSPLVEQARQDVVRALGLTPQEGMSDAQEAA